MTYRDNANVDEVSAAVRTEIQALLGPAWVNVVAEDPPAGRVFRVEAFRDSQHWVVGIMWRLAADVPEMCVTGAAPTSELAKLLALAGLRHWFHYCWDPRRPAP